MHLLIEERIVLIKSVLFCYFSTGEATQLKGTFEVTL